MKGIAWITAFCFLLAIPSGWSQDPENPSLSWGPSYRAEGNTTLEKVVGFTPEDIYFLRVKHSGAFSNRDKIYMERYSRDLKLKHSEEIVLQYDKTDVTLEDVLFLHNQLYLLTSYANQSHEKVYLFLQKLSDRQMRPTGEAKKIVEGPLTRNSIGRTFDFQLSADSSHLLVYHQIPTASKEPERFALHVFDQDMALEWEREVMLPYPDEQFSIREYRIDETGSVYLMGAVIEPGQRNRSLPAHYLVLEYRPGDLAPVEWKIGLEDKFITELTFRIAKNGDLICSGFYSERDAQSAKGICYFRLDAATRRVVTQTWQPFEFEFRAEELSNRGRQRAFEAEAEGNERRSAELYGYNLDELVLRTDGGALLVAEQFYVEERFNRYWDGTLHVTYLYHYNDLIVVNIQPSGTIEWTVRIPKQQVSIDDGGYFSSYSMATVRDRLYFLYNDNSRNFDPKTREGQLYSFNGSQAVIALAEVRKDGAFSVSPLALSEGASIMARPKIGRQIGGRLLLIVGEWGRNLRLGNVVFPAR
ncbi:MAG: hypothetical protein IPL49_11570 [Saprospirales bacterium]|nr:hypothetical protein [Saprospirales bacterium]MBK8491492.1 hypothetical protein [Saprospirales bacterium]